jgi:microcystin degradation protein MlrC
MVEHADALVAFRTYPHVDMAQTGARCLPVLEQLLGGMALAKAFRRGSYLVPLPAQCSTLEPAASLFASLEDREYDLRGTMSLVMGFPAADIPFCGPSVLAYGPDPARTVAAADEMAAALTRAEPGFAGRLWHADAAVGHAIAAAGEGPVVLADTQDNPGGGGTGDTTGLLEALIARQAQGAVLGLLIDPVAARMAHDAGAGATVSMALGGRHGPPGVRPLEMEYDVVRLGSGRFLATGPFYGGNMMELGPMALLRVRSAPGVQVAVASRRVQAADQAMFRHLGVEPASQRILALKSSVHFRADFEPLASEILVVAAPGFVPGDPATLPFQHLPQTMRLGPGLVASNAV